MFVGYGGASGRSQVLRSWWRPRRPLSNVADAREFSRRCNPATVAISCCVPERILGGISRLATRDQSSGLQFNGAFPLLLTEGNLDRLLYTRATSATAMPRVEGKWVAFRQRTKRRSGNAPPDHAWRAHSIHDASSRGSKVLSRHCAVSRSAIWRYVLGN